MDCRGKAREIAKGSSSEGYFADSVEYTPAMQEVQAPKIGRGEQVTL